MVLQHIQDKIHVPWLSKLKPPWTGPCLPLRFTPHLTQSCILYSTDPEKFMLALTHYNVSFPGVSAHAPSSAQSWLLSWLILLLSLEDLLQELFPLGGLFWVYHLRLGTLVSHDNLRHLCCYTYYLILIWSACLSYFWLAYQDPWELKNGKTHPFFVSSNSSYFPTTTVFNTRLVFQKY